MLLLLAAGCIIAAQSPPPEAPSVAVFSIRADAAVTESIAAPLSDVLVDQVRRSGVFGRLMTDTEIENVLGLEQQRQLLSCDDASCLAELAGAMGTDYVLSGRLGRLGDSYVLTLRLVNARNAAVVASRSEQWVGKQEEQLVSVVRSLAHGLLVDAGFKPRAAPPVTNAADAESSAPALLPVGVGGLVVGGALGAAGLLAAVLGASVVVVSKLVYVPTPFLDRNVRWLFFPTVGAVPGVVGLLAMLSALALTGAATATLAFSLMRRE